jgi:hypothetical protein
MSQQRVGWRGRFNFRNTSTCSADRQTARWRSVPPDPVMELHTHQSRATPIRERRLVHRNFKFNFKRNTKPRKTLKSWYCPPTSLTLYLLWLEGMSSLSCVLPSNAYTGSGLVTSTVAVTDRTTNTWNERHGEEMKCVCGTGVATMDQLRCSDKVWYRILKLQFVWRELFRFVLV